MVSFRSEINIARKVQHPNIMPILDVCEIVMDSCLTSEFAWPICTLL
jgi:hypothetical protein